MTERRDWEPEARHYVMVVEKLHVTASRVLDAITPVATDVKDAFSVLRDLLDSALKQETEHCAKMAESAPKSEEITEVTRERLDLVRGLVALRQAKLGLLFLWAAIDEAGLEAAEAELVPDEEESIH
jgi:hypothetical protein